MCYGGQQDYKRIVTGYLQSGLTMTFTCSVVYPFRNYEVLSDHKSVATPGTRQNIRQIFFTRIDLPILYSLVKWTSLSSFLFLLLKLK